MGSVVKSEDGDGRNLTYTVYTVHNYCIYTFAVVFLLLKLHHKQQEAGSASKKSKKTLQIAHSCLITQLACDAYSKWYPRDERGKKMLMSLSCLPMDVSLFLCVLMRRHFLF